MPATAPVIQPGNLLLFLGDSITHAHRRPEEHHDCYNLGGGYVKMIAATLNSDRPDLRLRFLNRGECGHTVRDLAGRWQRDCLDHQPDVISILIGINDSNPAGKGTVRGFAMTYRKLLKQTRAALPQATLILMEPFALAVPKPKQPIRHVSAQQLQELKERQPIVARLAKEFAAVFVPLQEVFDRAAQRAPSPHWALDGVHASAAGQLLIARQWLGVACGNLPGEMAPTPALGATAKMR